MKSICKWRKAPAESAKGHLTIAKKATIETAKLVEPSFLFRFSAPLYTAKSLWSDEGLQLGKKHIVPSFAELNGAPYFADLRAAWSDEGLGVTLRVVGKKTTPWCRESRIEDSDGLHLLIDTRDTHNIHRANRFCHRFAVLPTGGGRSQEEPIARLVDINRAREMPQEIPPDRLKVRSESRIDGYLLFLHIPSNALTGFDPIEHPRLGFCYAIADRELGWQTFNLGPEYPILEDPSLWGTLELV